MMENMTIRDTEVLAFAGYAEFERAADRTATKIKEGYMEMGYILKMARDTDILSGSGYGGYEEFADQRYGLDKGTVSRYIRIVERFSEGGNSHILKESYRNMGFSKLSIMLHMPDAIAEELMESLSKTEVQAIKEELDAESAISDIEVAIEAAIEAADEPGRIEIGESMLEKAVWQLGKEQQELYRKLWEACRAGETWKLKDILAPQGDAVYMVRIPGTGRLMLSITDRGATITNTRSLEKESAQIEELEGEAERICPAAGTVQEAYRRVYGIEMSLPEEKPAEKREVAPVQPQKEKRKESKVTKANLQPERPKKKQDPKDGMTEGGPEQVEGQRNIEDYPEYLPEQTEPEEKTEVAPVQPEVILPPEDIRELPAGYQDADATGEQMVALWNRAELAVSKLNIYFRSHSTRDYDTEGIKRCYQDAIDLAAALEQLSDQGGQDNG